MQQGEEDLDFIHLIREYNMQTFDDPDTEHLNDTVLDQMESIHALDREKAIEVGLAKWNKVYVFKATLFQRNHTAFNMPLQHIWS